MRIQNAIAALVAVATLTGTAAIAAEPPAVVQAQLAQEHRIAEIRAVDQRLAIVHARREQSEYRLRELHVQRERLEAEVAQLSRDEAALVQSKHALEGR